VQGCWESGNRSTDYQPQRGCVEISREMIGWEWPQPRCGWKCLHVRSRDDLPGWLPRKSGPHGRAADVEVFHRREADDGGGINGVFAVRDGGDMEDWIRLGQRVIAGVIAERTFIAQRLGRVNVALDDEVGVWQNGFQFGQNVFKAQATREKPPEKTS
jgi:hypothetical protein